MKIKNDIKLARMKKNLSQEQLAKLLQVEIEVVEAWESGERLPNLEERRFLSDILDIPYHRSSKLKDLIYVVLILLAMVVAFILLNVEEESWNYITDDLKVKYHYTIDKNAIELNSVAYRINEEDIEFKIDADYQEFAMITCFNRDVGYVKRMYQDDPDVVKVKVKKSDFEKMDKLGISLLLYSDKGNGEIGNTADMFIYFDELVPQLHQEIQEMMSK